ncbi:putative lipoprotein YmbA [Azospirillum lipoferum]|uniref:Membrane integrity-associated transporter subunit PqiC n=1 Tax=Azospirillum lipoferum TaxID=193 RepID=A0A5A9GH20_AZOLI|nr:MULTISPECIES: PqiC family protein [Azospirillum]KAA0593004.1 membrane integrity-associated transporter subunit PqiC [Azospirillum lipoferum]MCP1613934.1 putative lipoprotein YmbA [Azospirillum lipoferum]MDW5537672.1 PqiC family protein [Azospirillum sp. NL1]
MTRISSRHLLLALCLALPAGCGTSPPPRYHALSRPDDALPASGQARMLVEILPVAVPEALTRSNLVLTDETGQVTVMEAERWLSPIGDELRQILADGLWRTARASDTYQAPVSGSAVTLPLFRLAVRLDRFEAVPGRAAMIDASWTLRRLPDGPVQGCRWAGRQPVDGRDAAAAAAALSAVSRRLADRIGDSLRHVAAGQGLPCPDESR